MNSEAIKIPDVKTIGNTIISLTTADITDLHVEAFVFYARPDLVLGSGFGNAIATRGGPSVKKELDQLGSVAPTQSVVTSAGKMKAKYIIHSAGPVFQEENTPGKLRVTVLNALKCAEDKGISQVAFPPMGTGFYGIPLALCSEVMFDAFKEYLSKPTALQEVIICANDKREYRSFKGRFDTLNSK